MRPATRYWLLQLPGNALAAVIAYVTWRQEWLNAYEAGAVVLLWVLKDAILYPMYRKAFTIGPGHFANAGIIGASGRVTRADGPEIVVAIGHEYWRARCADGRALQLGERIRVIGRDGPRLWITKIDAAPPAEE